MALWASPVSGQTTELPESIVSSQSISRDDERSIEAYVTPLFASLESEEPAVLRSARTDLLGPVMNPQVTVQFRIAYTAAMKGPLQALDRDGSDVAAVNAVVIAGHLASGDGVSILRDALRDERVAIRFAAAAGYGRTLTADSPALAARELPGLFRDLSRALDQEQDPFVIEAFVKSLAMACKPREGAIEGLTEQAVRTTAEGVGKKAVGADQARAAMMHGAFLRSAIAVRNVLIVPGNSLAAADRKAIAGMGGRLLVHAIERIRGGDADAEERATLVQLVDAASALVIFSARADGVTVDDPNLGRLLRDGQDDRFVRDATGMISSVRSGFSLPADFFKLAD